MPNTHAQLQMGGKNDKETVLKLQQLLNEKSDAGLATDGIFGPKTNQAVRDYQKNNALQVDGIVGPKTWASLLATTQEPEVPAQPEAPLPESPAQTAKKALDDHTEKAPEPFLFDRQYLLDLAQKAYLERQDFAYDPNADALYRQYKDDYAAQGRMAMEDTMGLAQRMTGGYSNSYAQTAGQQAYGAYLEKVKDILPKLYDLAYEKWQKGTERLSENYQQLQSQKEDAYKAHQATEEQYKTREKTLYNAWQDALQEQNRQYTRLKALIGLGYLPTDQELAAAGMTRAQARALMPSKEAV